MITIILCIACLSLGSCAGLLVAGLLRSAADYDRDLIDDIERRRTIQNQWWQRP